MRFLIDANGILHVSAREQRSGKEAEIKVQPSYGLTDEQVEDMILDSYRQRGTGLGRTAVDRGAQRGRDDSDSAGQRTPQ